MLHQLMVLRLQTGPGADMSSHYSCLLSCIEMVFHPPESGRSLPGSLNEYNFRLGKDHNCEQSWAGVRF